MKMKNNIKLHSYSIALLFPLTLLTGCGGEDAYSDDINGADGAPTLTRVVLSPNNQTTPLTVNDQVTLTITANEPILAPSVLIAGDAPDTLTGGGTQWTAVRNMQLGDPEGTIAISISYNDVGGTAGVSVNQTTDNSTASYENPDAFQLASSSDEFNDLSQWQHELGDGTEFGIPGWGNNELQFYVEQQASIEDGVLAITAAASEGTSYPYVSSRLRSNFAIDMSKIGGRVEVRAQMPEGQGLWPAIWMLPTQEIVEQLGVWPTTGEVDIVEATNLGVNGKQDIVSTLHYGFRYPHNTFNFSHYNPGTSPQDDFHVYAMEWNHDAETGLSEIRFYFDDVHFATQNSDNWLGLTQNELGQYYELDGGAPFNQPFNLILNVAVGGNLPGNPDNSTVFPQQMLVDYVRIYDCVYPHADDPCKTNYNPDIAPVNGVGSIQTYQLDVYQAEQPNPQTFTINGVEYTNPMATGTFTDTDNGAELIDNNFNAQDPMDNDNSVWHWQIAGGVANSYIGSADLTDDEVLNTGFNLSGADIGGQIRFKLYIEALAEGTDLLVKLDSGFPNLGQITLPQMTQGEWHNVSVNISDLAANPFAGGTGLDLGNVLNLFVIEAVNPQDLAATAANLYIDDVGLDFACGNNSRCQPQNKASAVNARFPVYEEMVSEAYTTAKLSAFDEAIGFSSCTDDNGAGCPSVNWQEMTADEAERGNVIQVDYSTDAQFAGLVVGIEAAGIDLSNFINGKVVFDINVLANPNNASFIVKEDCVDCPSTGNGEREVNVGQIAAGWQTVEVNVRDMVNTVGGLQLGKVTTGLVLFPTAGNTAGISYQLDNIAWIPGEDTPAPAPTETFTLFDNALADGFSLNLFDNQSTDSVSITAVDSDDAQHQSAIIINNGTSTETVTWVEKATPQDISGYSSGMIKFDVYMHTPPTEPSATYRIKIESQNSGGDADNSSDELVFATQSSIPQGQWHSISVPITDLLNGSFEAALWRKVTIFNDWGLAAGSVFEIDNLRISADGQTDILIFDDQLASDFSFGFYDNQFTDTVSIVADVASTGHAQVIEINNGNSNETVTWVGTGVNTDLSNFSNGELKFELLVKTLPTDPSANYLIKIESNNSSDDCADGCTGGAEVTFKTQAEVELNQWQNISIPVTDLNNGDFDISQFRNVVLLNNWGMASGSVFQIDNLRFERPEE